MPFPPADLLCHPFYIGKVRRRGSIAKPDKLVLPDDIYDWVLAHLTDAQ